VEGKMFSPLLHDGFCFDERLSYTPLGSVVVQNMLSKNVRERTTLVKGLEESITAVFWTLQHPDEYSFSVALLW